MPYLIKGANVFTPKFLGKKDVLILDRTDAPEIEQRTTI